VNEELHKPDWVYDKMWSDEDEVVKNLPNPEIGTSAFTIEAAICCDEMAGGTIFSFMPHRYGFEWRALSKDCPKQ